MSNNNDNDDFSSFIFDIDLIKEIEFLKMDFDNILKEINDLREKELDIFESIITDKLREVFNNDF